MKASFGRGTAGSNPNLLEIILHFFYGFHIFLYPRSKILCVGLSQARSRLRHTLMIALRHARVHAYCSLENVKHLLHLPILVHLLRLHHLFHPQLPLQILRMLAYASR